MTSESPPPGRFDDGNEPASASVQLPPHDPDAEAVVVAYCLSAQSTDRVRQLVRPADFYLDATRLVFTAIQAIESAGSVPDLVSVSRALREHGHLERVGGTPYLMRLFDGTPSYPVGVQSRALEMTLDDA